MGEKMTAQEALRNALWYMTRMKRKATPEDLEYVGALRQEVRSLEIAKTLQGVPLR